jgi:hypothetical protein
LSALAAVVVVILLVFLAIGMTSRLGDWLSSLKEKKNDIRFATPHGSLNQIILITDCQVGKNHLAFAVGDPELLADVASQLNNPTHESGPPRPEAILGCVLFEFESGTLNSALTIDWTTLPQPDGLHRINLRRVFEKLRQQFKEPEWFFREPPKVN